MAKRDFYEVMGVSRNASEDDIKKAYRKLARKYHPDVSKEPDAEAQFKELGEAYEVLKDPRKRSAYDQFGHAGVSNQPPPPRGGGMGGFPFDDIFGGHRRSGFTRMSVTGQFGNSSWSINHLGNVEVVAMIPLRIMVQGHPAYPVHYPYPVHGNVTGIDRRAIAMKILQDTPVFHQEIIENVLPDGGILNIQMVPLQDGGFFPDGADILTEVAIDTLDAIVGGDLTVPHPSGAKMKIKLKPNTKDGVLLRLAGKGLLHKSGSRGDFVVGIAHHTMNYNDSQLEVLRKAVKKIREEMKHG